MGASTARRGVATSVSAHSVKSDCRVTMTRVSAVNVISLDNLSVEYLGSGITTAECRLKVFKLHGILTVQVPLTDG